jgi:hypothetical protein
LEEKEEEQGKYIPSMERDEYEIGQNIITTKTTNKKIKWCSNKH